MTVGHVCAGVEQGASELHGVDICGIADYNAVRVYRVETHGSGVSGFDRTGTCEIAKRSFA